MCSCKQVECEACISSGQFNPKTFYVSPAVNHVNSFHVYLCMALQNKMTNFPFPSQNMHKQVHNHLLPFKCKQF